MHCLSNDRLIQYADEQLTVSQANAAQQHVGECGKCNERLAQIRRLTDAVAKPAPGSTGGDFAADAMARIRGGKRPTFRFRFRLAAAAALAIVAVPVGLVVFQNAQPPPGTFTARGGGTTVGSEEKAVGIQTYAVDGATHSPLAPTGTTVNPTVGLAFSYSNLSDTPRYLLAFGIDAHGEVHWFYPAYLDAKSNPMAVSMAAGRRAHMLPDVVQPENCPPGVLRIVTIASERQRSVREVENLVAGLPSSEPAATHFANDVVNEWLLTIESAP